MAKSTKKTRAKKGARFDRITMDEVQASQACALDLASREETKQEDDEEYKIRV